MQYIDQLAQGLLTKFKGRTQVWLRTFANLFTCFQGQVRLAVRVERLGHDEIRAGLHSPFDLLLMQMAKQMEKEMSEEYITISRRKMGPRIVRLSVREVVMFCRMMQK